MQYEKYLNLFVLTTMSILLIACSTFKQEKLNQRALETGTFTSQVCFVVLTVLSCISSL